MICGNQVCSTGESLLGDMFSAAIKPICCNQNANSFDERDNTFIQRPTILTF